MRGMDAAAAIARFNRLPREAAAERLRRCCGSDEWARRMAAGRPYSALAELLAAADRHWRALPAEAHQQAFAAHPEIGDAAKAAGEARQEQAGVAEASNATRAELARKNRAYRQKFGFIFLICASGLSADAMLAELRARLKNSAAQERANAAQEQLKITRLRLQKMFAEAAAAADSSAAGAAKSADADSTIAAATATTAPPEPRPAA